MCGRYGRRADKQRFAEYMQTHDTNGFDDTYLAPSYNIAPRLFQPIVSGTLANRFAATISSGRDEIVEGQPCSGNVNNNGPELVEPSS
jgi:hypothetical protein